MKYTTVKMSDIAKCKTHNMSPDHWIPEHKLEECEPELIEKAKKFKAEQVKKRKEFADKTKKETEVYVSKLRVYELAKREVELNDKPAELLEGLSHD